MRCTRRVFLEVIGLGTAAGAVLAACGPGGASLPTAATTACGGGTCIDLADPTNAPLTTVGGAMFTDIGSDTVIVVRVSEASVIALSAICTHAGCLVDFNASAQRLDCNCHGSAFDETGRVIAGPARSPLRQYVATLASNTITIA